MGSSLENASLTHQQGLIKLDDHLYVVQACWFSHRKSGAEQCHGRHGAGRAGLLLRLTAVRNFVLVRWLYLVESISEIWWGNLSLWKINRYVESTSDDDYSRWFPVAYPSKPLQNQHMYSSHATLCIKPTSCPFNIFIRIRSVYADTKNYQEVERCARVFDLQKNHNASTIRRRVWAWTS